MFEKEAKEYREEWQNKGYYFVSQEMEQIELDDIVDATFKDGAATTLRKVIKYFSVRVIDENCGGYFSRLLESEEELQKLAKELESV